MQLDEPFSEELYTGLKIAHFLEFSESSSRIPFLSCTVICVILDHKSKPRSPQRNTPQDYSSFNEPPFYDWTVIIFCRKDLFLNESFPFLLFPFFSLSFKFRAIQRFRYNTYLGRLRSIHDIKFILRLNVSVSFEILTLSSGKDNIDSSQIWL